MAGGVQGLPEVNGCRRKVIGTGRVVVIYSEVVGGPWKKGRKGLMGRQTSV